MIFHGITKYTKEYTCIVRDLGTLALNVMSTWNALPQCSGTPTEEKTGIF